MTYQIAAILFILLWAGSFAYLLMRSEKFDRDIIASLLESMTIAGAAMFVLSLAALLFIAASGALDS